MSESPGESQEGKWNRFLERSSYLREYLWKYRGYVALGLLSLLIVDILEVLPPIFLKDSVDVVVARGPERRLVELALAYAAVAAIQGLGRYGWRMFLIRASMFSGRDIRGRFAHQVFSLPMSFHDRKRIGDLMSLLTSDVESVRMTLGPGILVFADALFYFIAVPIAMYALSPKLTLLALLPLPIIPFLVFYNEREIDRRYEGVQEQFSAISAMVQEGLNGIRVVKAFAKEDVQIARLKAAGEEYARRSLKLARIQTAFGPELDFMMSLGLVLLLFIGGHDMIGASGSGALAGAVTLGTFVAFQRYIQKMVWPMAAFGMAIAYYQRSITSSERLKTIFEEESDVPEAHSPQKPERIAGAVSFRGLRFKFPGTDKYVLQDINLEIAPGERVAFIGAVGSGKSALLSLLPRLYPVERGMLFVDGIDINDWPIEELRRNVGYVSQDVFLFSESVRDNVAYGLGRVSDDLQDGVENATRLAVVHDDMQGLPGSYGTRLGERGVNLSGGQKQRLTIARALAKKPAILVLDDALSSVDVQTEEKILRGLAARPGRNTEIIAAHRISTIRDATRIVVLGESRIRQMGTHEQLIADRRGAYRQYYEQQRLREDLENFAEALPEKFNVTP